jgi:hypothetical protein
MKATLLKPLYTKTIRGLPLLGTPTTSAHRFTDAEGSHNTDTLIAYYTGLSGATGFVCGLPGFLMLPVTLPTNVVGVAALQMHMSASIAVMGGHDLQAPQTRDRCIDCLLEKVDHSGSNTEEEEMATRTGIKLAERAVRYTAAKSMRLARKAARSYALRKLGARRLPLIGGVLGASTDAYVTRHVGQCARRTFLES